MGGHLLQLSPPLRLLLTQGGIPQTSNGTSYALRVLPWV
jgi:hypothetical protein